MTKRDIRVLCSLGTCLGVLVMTPVFAQKSGGVLRIPTRDNPPSASIHEETTSSTLVPFMPVFNNLVIQDQHAQRSDSAHIKPDLAASWAWGDEGRTLTFKLTQGVKWHDGKPFSSADVKCTWDTVRGVRESGWRKNPRLGWYSNIQDIVPNGDLEVSFKLKRPQPSFLSFLASGFSPVYPCHVDARAMRTTPIGTGPFKLAEFKPNELIRLVKNPDYFKKGLPMLDGILYRVVPNQGTRTLGFVAGEFDLTWPNDANRDVAKDIVSKNPKAICEIGSTPSTGQLLINPKSELLRDPKLRKAIALAIDRDGIAAVTTQSKSDIGGVMLAPPAGEWGVTRAELKEAPGYGSDVEKNREAARALMKELGWGPDKRLKVKMMSVNRNNQTVPTLVFIDQLRSIFVDATLDAVDISVWTQRATRRADYDMSYWSSAPAMDDPDPIFYEGYKCGSSRNYTDYCDKTTDEMIDLQSSTQDPKKRLELVRQIDVRLQQQVARPILHGSILGTCRLPKVKGTVQQTNNIYNTFRYEDVWLSSE